MSINSIKRKKLELKLENCYLDSELTKIYTEIIDKEKRESIFKPKTEEDVVEFDNDVLHSMEEPEEEGIEKKDYFKDIQIENIKTYLRIIYNEDNLKLIRDRIKGKTLKQIGQERNISSERIRVIEKRINEKINKMIFMYSTFIKEHYFDHNDWFRKNVFKKEIGYYDEIVYSISHKNVRKSEIVFSDVFNVITLKKHYKDEKIIKNVLKRKTYTKWEGKIIVGRAITLSGYSEAVLERINIDNFFKRQGYTVYPKNYSKEKMNHGDAILELLEMYFPKGVKVRSETDENGEKIYDYSFLKLKKMMKEKYGIVSKSNYALIFKIRTVSVYYGNSIFNHPNTISYSDSDIEILLEYIRNKKGEDVYFLELYNYFKTLDTEENNITDKFKLHGAMSKYFREHEEKSKLFTVKRDKVCFNKIKD